MGEYVKYKGEVVKIGTCESLYYATYEKYLDALKKNQLSFHPGNDLPAAYASADSGYRFRFPFPDEDKLSIGDAGYKDFSRGVPIAVRQSEVTHTTIQEERYQMEITQQKLIHRQSDGKLCLALVWRDSTGQSFRVEDDADLKDILKEMIRHHILDNADPKQKAFYREIAARALKGYRIGNPSLSQKQQQKKDNSQSQQQPIKNQRRKGL